MLTSSIQAPSDDAPTQPCAQLEREIAETLLRLSSAISEDVAAHEVPLPRREAEREAREQVELLGLYLVLRAFFDGRLKQTA